MLICIKGAGDLASGIALRLHRAGFKIVMTELPVPISVRRNVSFCEAVRLGKTMVEDAAAERAETLEAVLDCLQRDVIPVMPDPEAKIIRLLRPEVVVDAIIAKRNTGTCINDAPLVIGVGPGFTAGVDCHAVIETKRGHTLGRVIRNGSAISDTKIPGNIGGETVNRVIRATADGIFHPEADIGTLVSKGDIVGYVDEVPVHAKIDGLVRGMLPDGVPVTTGFKAGDIDPRGASVNYHTVSDKATAIGGGVLEALMGFVNSKESNNYQKVRYESRRESLHYSMTNERLGAKKWQRG